MSSWIILRYDVTNATPRDLDEPPEWIRGRVLEAHYVEADSKEAAVEKVDDGRHCLYGPIELTEEPETFEAAHEVAVAPMTLPLEGRVRPEAPSREPTTRST